MFGPSLLFARDVIEALEERAGGRRRVGLPPGRLRDRGAERAGVRSVALIHTVYPVPTEGVPPFGLGLPLARGVLGSARDAALRPMLAPDVQARPEGGEPGARGARAAGAAHARSTS